MPMRRIIYTRARAVMLGAHYVGRSFIPSTDGRIKRFRMKSRIRYKVSWDVYDHISCDTITLDKGFRSSLAAMLYAWKMLIKGRDGICIVRCVPVVKMNMR